MDDTRQFAKKHGVELASQDEIYEQAAANLVERHGYTSEQVKDHFDDLIVETENEAYQVYLECEQSYARKVFQLLVDQAIQEGELSHVRDAGRFLGDHFHQLDSFFLSLAQGRKARAGGTFEKIVRGLFKTLNYPFDEQKQINGKPDFVMPSYDHYQTDPLDCVVFTVKRTLRERWRQIVTEGAAAPSFYLGTIDDGLSSHALREMHHNSIRLVVPEPIRQDNYADATNVLTFRTFFRDELDPAVQRWKRKGLA